MEGGHIFMLSFLLPLLILTPKTTAQLRQNYYANICPNAESIVRTAVSQKLQSNFNAAAGTLRLFFHDCFVRGCDASVLLMNNDDEHGAGPNLSLSPDALDLINKAKAAVDSNPQCTNKVSCADILAMAARDVVSLAGGLSYPVELGRLDGRVSTRAIVKHSLPDPSFSLNQLNSLFFANGLSQTDMIALSGAHTIGVTHCDRFIRRIYQFKGPKPKEYNPPMNLWFLRSMRKVCPLNYTPSSFAMLDNQTPSKFDNAYYQNLQQMKGILASDQILFTDRRSRGTVSWFASNQTAFFEAFVTAMTKLGRVGVKTGSNGEIRQVCTAVN